MTTEESLPRGAGRASLRRDFSKGGMVRASQASEALRGKHLAEATAYAKAPEQG